MTYSRLAQSGISTLALGFWLSATPVTLDLNPADDGIVGLKISQAFAKDGRSDKDDSDDDGGGSGSGKGRSGSSDDDRGGSGSGGGRSGSSDDDRGGSGRGDGRSGSSDDDRGGSGSGGGRSGSSDDDRGGSGRGSGRSGSSDDSADRDDDRGRDSSDDNRRESSSGRRGTSDSSDGAGLRVVKIEQSGSSVEIVYSNGIKEEIEGDRYELKNAAGRTVVERVATSDDRVRIESNVVKSGVSKTQGAGASQSTRRVPSGSQVRRAEVGARSVEVSYSTGWREEIRNSRYELKDPNNNTVVERRATQADVDRLMAVAR